MDSFLLPILFAACAGLLGWFAAFSRSQEAAKAARAEIHLLSQSRDEAIHQKELAEQRLQDHIASAEQALQAQKQTDSELRAQLRESFKTMATEALEDNRKASQDETKLVIKPIQDALGKVEEANQLLEKERQTAYGKLSGQLEALAGQTESLRDRSDTLATILRGSNQARGNWGELLLRNVVEFAGMEEHVHFEEQVTVGDGRPDMVIKLPGKAGIPVDSKCPYTAFDKASQEENPEKRTAYLEEHARNVRDRMKELKKKDYAKTIGAEIDFTVMFLPGDHILDAALRVDPTIQEDALRDRILITSPVSLVALLRTVGIYWSQDAAQNNAQKIQDASLLLYERVHKFMEHFSKIGSGLKSATDKYHAALGSWERRVIPAGEKLQALQGPSKQASLEESKHSPKAFDTHELSG